MESCSRESLQQFLNENATDLSSLSLEEFRDWLEARIERANQHPLFQERCRSRDLRRRYRSPLRFRERRLNRAEQEYRADPLSRTIEELRENVRDLTNAVEGLSQAVAEKRADPAKLAEFAVRRAIAIAEYDQLRNTTPTWHQLEQARQSLAAFQQEIGLTEIEKSIARLSLERGRISSRSGQNYQQTVSRTGRDLIVKSLAERENFEGQSMELLHGVTLGCARGEFDQMIVTAAKQDEPVRVLAIVEAKKNINDLVHGFRIRQENLAWLVGDRSGYVADLYRTRYFPEGHFTTAVHPEHGRRYHFNRDSFQRYATPDKAGYRLEGLWFITNRRPLLGVTSGELGRILYQVSMNPSLNLSSHSGLDKFRKWVLNTISDYQTHDVLRLYATTNELAPQIILND